MIEQTLKPCPFCAGEAEWNIGRHADGSDWNYIACKDCETVGPNKSLQMEGLAFDWNARSGSEAEQTLSDDEIIELAYETERALPDAADDQEKLLAVVRACIESAMRGQDAQKAFLTMAHAERLLSIAEECPFLHTDDGDFLREMRALLAAPQPDVAPDIDAMIDRFLAWKLPEDFAPDGGISFDRMINTREGRANRPCDNIWWPTGTNLFTATQAKAMLEYMLPTTGVQGE